MVPGFVTSDVRFATGASAVALLGGEMVGVATVDDLDEFRLDYREEVWQWDSNTAAWAQRRPGDELLMAFHPELFPISFSARMSAALGDGFGDYEFTLGVDGSVSRPDEPKRMPGAADNSTVVPHVGRAAWSSSRIVRGLDPTACPNGAAHKERKRAWPNSCSE